MIQTLEQVLECCIVKLKIPNRLGWGTGFFVASDLVLTCAHVVKEAASPHIEVHWEKQGKFETALIEKIYPEPFDIALIRLSSTSNNFSCVYLDTDIRSGDIFYTFGYPDDFQPGAPVTFECEGITGDNPPFIKFKHGQARHGLSGSPLLNKRTGKVCGMVKFTRGTDTNLGGGGILTETFFAKFSNLKEQQHEFHKDDQTWLNALKSTFAVEVEGYVDDYIKGWTNRARSYAQVFSDSRFAVSGDKSTKWGIQVITGNTVSSEFRKEIKSAFKEFSGKINSAVTLLERDLFLSKINNLKLELYSQELSDDEKVVIKLFLSPLPVLEMKFEVWNVVRGTMVGASFGAVTGSSIPVIGTLFGASIGAAIGAMSSDNIQMHQMSKEASTQIIEYVDKSTKELIVRKKEIVDYILSLLVGKPEISRQRFLDLLKEQGMDWL